MYLDWIIFSVAILAWRMKIIFPKFDKATLNAYTTKTPDNLNLILV